MHALVADGKVIQVGPETFPVVDDLVWVDVTFVRPLPEHGWSATETAGVWSFAAAVPSVATP